MRALSTSWMVSGTTIAAASRASTTSPFCAPQAAVLDERAGHLLDEERIALGLRGDERLRLGRELRAAEQRARHRGDVGRGERLERDPQVVAPIAERVAVAGPMRAHQERAHRRHGGGDERQVLLRGGIDPVQVLDDDDDRRPRRGGTGHLRERAEGLAAPARRVERFDRGVSRLEAQHLPHERHRPGEVGAERRDAVLDLDAGGAVVVAVVDREEAAQPVDDRQERGRRAVGCAPPLDPQVRLAGESRAAARRAGATCRSRRRRRRRRRGRGRPRRSRRRRGAAPSSRLAADEARRVLVARRRAGRGRCPITAATRSESASPTRRSRAPQLARPLDAARDLVPTPAPRRRRHGRAGAPPARRCRRAAARVAIGSAAPASTRKLPRCAAIAELGRRIARPSSKRWMASAACTARCGSCSSARGTPNTAVRRDGVRVRKTPPKPATRSDDAVRPAARHRPRIVRRCSGSTTSIGEHRDRLHLPARCRGRDGRGHARRGVDERRGPGAGGRALRRRACARLRRGVRSRRLERRPRDAVAPHPVAERVAADAEKPRGARRRCRPSAPARRGSAPPRRRSPGARGRRRTPPPATDLRTAPARAAGCAAARARRHRSFRPSESSVTRSIRCASSRTLPGQGWPASQRRAPSSRRFGARPCAAACSARKCSASSEHVLAAARAAAAARGRRRRGGGRDRRGTRRRRPARAGRAASPRSASRRRAAARPRRDGGCCFSSIAFRSLPWSVTGSASISSRKRVPPARGLEEAGLRALRVGEGAGLEAEELGLEHGLGDGGAVHVDERPARAAAALVDHARDQSLAGAGLPLEQHRRHVRSSRRVERRQVQDLRPERLDRRGSPDDRVECIVAGHLAAASRGPPSQTWPRRDRITLGNRRKVAGGQAGGHGTPLAWSASDDVFTNHPRRVDHGSRRSEVHGVRAQGVRRHRRALTASVGRDRRQARPLQGAGRRRPDDARRAGGAYRRPPSAASASGAPRRRRRATSPTTRRRGATRSRTSTRWRSPTRRARPACSAASRA